jgi:hypothetical protein
MDDLSNFGVSLRPAPADTASVRAGYLIAAIVVGALVAVPASASAKPHGHGGGQAAGLAAQQCAQEKGDIGKKAFRKKYGARNTTRSCIRRTQPQVAAAIPIATRDCQDELTSFGTDVFVAVYGDDVTTPLDVAMAECVAEGVDSILNPDDGSDDEDGGDVIIPAPVPGPVPPVATP